MLWFTWILNLGLGCHSVTLSTLHAWGPGFNLEHHKTSKQTKTTIKGKTSLLHCLHLFTVVSFYIAVFKASFFFSSQSFAKHWLSSCTFPGSLRTWRWIRQGSSLTEFIAWWEGREGRDDDQRFSGGWRRVLLSSGTSQGEHLHWVCRGERHQGSVASLGKLPSLGWI
jgi:hypothetical protein